MTDWSIAQWVATGILSGAAVLCVILFLIGKARKIAHQHIWSDVVEQVVVWDEGLPTQRQRVFRWRDCRDCDKVMVIYNNGFESIRDDI